LKKVNYDSIDNNYVARRIIELSTGKYSINEISEIIGSERSLERIFLNQDVQAYVNQFKEDSLIYEKNDILFADEENCAILKQHFKNAENRGITRVLWDVTRKCNLKCQHCYAFKEGDHSEELSLEQVYKTIDDLKKIQPYLIVYGGGEPFARKDLIDILKRTKEVLNCRIKILTNGTMLTIEVMQEIKPYIDFVQISLDGKKENHDFLRGHNGSFEKAVEAKSLLEKKASRQEFV